MAKGSWKNKLYYGDNLNVLRLHIKDESVDLIYLDPPFKSEQDYNVLFLESDGTPAASQIQAFEDTWIWDQAAAFAYEETVEAGGDVAKALVGLRSFLGESDMLAYLSMMAPRLLDLRRVLKPKGSIYLHCDPTASHYLKLLMDSVFGHEAFRNEIIWKRTSGHSDARRYGRVHDVLLYYGRGPRPHWNRVYQPYDPVYVEQYYRYQDPDGRRFMSDNLSASGLTGGGYEYEWKGITRVWRCPVETMKRLDEEGRIFYTKKGIPRMKRYLDESKGLPAQDVWTDIEALRSWHAERLGYPTQKPEPLLERLMLASSDEGDVVLDPFCGCGTTMAVAQRLERRWIGIDITSLATNLIKVRLKDAYGDEVKNTYEVIGEPESVEDARVLAASDPYQFQWWALGLVGARPTEGKKGADRGIDGQQYFHDVAGAGATTRQILFSVKAGKTGPTHVRDLRGVVDREKGELGVLITMQDPTREMKKEAASAGFYEAGAMGKFPRIQIVTVQDLLDDKKLDAPPTAYGTFRRAPRARTGRPVEARTLFQKDAMDAAEDEYETDETPPF